MDASAISTQDDEPAACPVPDQDRPDRVWRDRLIMLLQIAAATEHALMVQYLYAAYSLNVDQKDAEKCAMVRRWQKSIIAIAKEEMGHLLTVQNILTLLGGPINLEREDFPWDAPYYPFKFTLEPLTMKSLTRYVYAEMPGPDEDKFQGPGVKTEPRFCECEENEQRHIIVKVNDQVQDWVQKAEKTAENNNGRGQKPRGGKIHRVGALYKEIIELVEDRNSNPKRIPDSAFQEATFNFQASWDDWGRGYQPDPHMLTAEGDRIESDQNSVENGLPASDRKAHVMIDRVATRTQVVDALRRIAGQGEAPHLECHQTGEPSHFDRFLEIYQDFSKIISKINDWSPALNVAVNPTTRAPDDGGIGAYIENEHSCNWARLFNLRYRMLLTYLGHTFRLARVTRPEEPSARAVVMHRVFGEMYNLKTIAGILVQLPLNGENGERAGPPFEIPYSLRLPPTEPDAWRLQRDLLTTADLLCGRLLDNCEERHQRYLRALNELDKKSMAWIDRILADLGPAARKYL